MSKKTKYIQSLFIKAPKQKVWQKITQTDAVLPFYHYSILRLKVEEFEEGAELVYEYQGEPHLAGKIVEFIPESKFSHTFRFAHLEEDETLVTWKLTDEGDGTRVELIHEKLAEGSETQKSVSSQYGWPVILKRLKDEIEQETYIST